MGMENFGPNPSNTEAIQRRRDRRKGSLYAVIGAQRPDEKKQSPTAPQNPDRTAGRSWGSLLGLKPELDPESPLVHAVDEVKKAESVASVGLLEDQDVVAPVEAGDSTVAISSEAQSTPYVESAIPSVGMKQSIAETVSEPRPSLAIWARESEEVLQKQRPVIEEVIWLHDIEPTEVTVPSEGFTAQPTNIEELIAAATTESPEQEAQDDEATRNPATAFAQMPAPTPDRRSWRQARGEDVVAMPPDTLADSLGVAPPLSGPRFGAAAGGSAPMEYLDAGFSTEPVDPNTYQPPVPQRTETRPNGGNGLVLAVAAYLFGRRGGRKKAERVAKPKFDALRRQNEQAQTVLQVTQAKLRAQQERIDAERKEFLSAERRQQIQAEHSEAERRREQAAAELRLRDAERQRKVAEMRATRAEHAPQATTQKEEETKDPGKIRSRMKHSVKARFEQFQKLQTRQEEPTAQQPVAGAGNHFERQGLFTHEVDAEGRIVDESQTVLKHSKEYNYERAPERGTAARGRTAGTAALIAAVVDDAQKTNKHGITNVIAADTSNAQKSDTPPSPPDASVRRQTSWQNLTPDFAGSSKASGPLWPYVVALIVIFICLLALLH